MKVLPLRSELPTLARTPATFGKRYRFPLVTLLIGATFDAITTYQNVRVFGTEIEVHPAHRLVYQVFGPAWGCALGKLLQLGFVLFVAAWWKPWCAFLLTLCGILYALAALNNHFLWL